MNKKMLFLGIFFVAASFSSMTFAGPWDWFKDKINSAMLIYKRWNIPRPRLIIHRVSMIDGKKCEMFGYDISKDTDSMKSLRKNVHVSGLYLADGSNLDTCVDNLPLIMNLEQFYENGLDLKLDNRVNKCMYRLLSSVAESSLDVASSPQEVSFVRLVWEIEHCLSDAFDQDRDGQLFIDFVREMLTKDIVAPTVEKPSIDFMTIFLSGMREDFARTAGITGQRVEQYLLLWARCTLRFRQNLWAAISQNRKRYGAE